MIRMGRHCGKASTPNSSGFNRSGSIAIDFLFAFTLVGGFTVLVFSLAITLTMIEVTQYVTYAAARTYMAAHESHERQQQLGQLKMAQLISSPVLAPMYSEGWFRISVTTPGNFANTFPEFAPSQAGEAQVDTFYGVSTPFIARVLNYNIPFFGSTRSDGQADGFRTNIHSFLGRQPSFQSCFDFMKAPNRYQGIRRLPVANGVLGYDQAPLIDNAYTPIMDNGC